MRAEGHGRYTRGLDIWIALQPSNARRIVEALRTFGFDLPALTPELFEREEQIVRLGAPPLRIQIHTSLSGVEFDDCYARRLTADIGGLELTCSDQDLERLGQGARPTAGQMRAAVLAGTSERVRPVAMTATATIGGLLPIMLGSGTGSDVMHRIAAPMAGGMVTATILGLVVLPVIYALVLTLRESVSAKFHME